MQQGTGVKIRFQRLLRMQRAKIHVKQVKTNYLVEFQCVFFRCLF